MEQEVRATLLLGAANLAAAEVSTIGGPVGLIEERLRESVDRWTAFLLVALVEEETWRI